MTELSISQARAQLTQLADRLPREGEAVEVTNRGKPVLAVLSWELYEAMEETIEILSDEELMKNLRQGIKEMEQGKLIPYDQVRKKLGLE
jgi:prevent-host-death family protein